MKLLISPCLLGIRTRWNEGCDEIKALVDLVRSGEAIFLCPEQIGGLSTPREPAEIEPGKSAVDVLNGKAKVLTIHGIDVTQQYVNGAQRILEFCQNVGVEAAILKSRSPSCGSQHIYDGTFSSTRIPGKGITSELLTQNGIKVYNETNYECFVPEVGGSEADG